MEKFYNRLIKHCANRECRVLRYLKGLQLLTEVHESKCLAVDRVWPFGRLTPEVQKQGSGGARERGFLESSGRTIDIRAVRVHFGGKEKLELRGFALSVGKDLLLYEITVGGEEYNRSIEWISFDYPSEYLVQVEGSYSTALKIPSLFSVAYRFAEGSYAPNLAPRVSSLSFITTRQKYGPYGTSEGPTTPCDSDSGRVVDFHWLSDGRISFHLEFLRSRPAKLLVGYGIFWMKKIDPLDFCSSPANLITWPHCVWVCPF